MMTFRSQPEIGERRNPNQNDAEKEARYSAGLFLLKAAERVKGEDHRKEKNPPLGGFRRVRPVLVRSITSADKVVVVIP